jgi:CRISPR-associated protein Cmr6
MAPQRPEDRRLRLPLYASFQTARLAKTRGNLGLLYDKFFDQTDPVAADTFSGNLGLLYDKFFGCWTAQWSVDGEEKIGWLQRLARHAGTSYRPDLLDEWGERTRALVRARGGRMGVFRAVERFVSGTGRTHPVENGFSFHHTLGVPYLPGSGLKGVARSWAGGACLADRLFGTSDRAGAVDVLDALPLKPPCLVVEVLTPHYGGWTPQDPPGDWRSPVPVPYLAVEAGMELLLALVGRVPRSNEEDIEEAWALLVEAVDKLGTGARTALGFGRLELVNELPLSAPASSADPRPGGLGRSATGSERWQAELAGKGDQEVYERVRQALRSGEADPDLLAALDTLGYLSAWREGRRRGTETTGARKLRELAAQLQALGAQGDAGNAGG